MFSEYLILLFICGMAGALVKDICHDGALSLPMIKDHKLFLGFLASAFIGGCVGVIVDHSYLTAFLSGHVGYSIIENLVAGKNSGSSLKILQK